MTHYFILAGATWGHLRPLQALSTRLCMLNPDLHITLILPKFLEHKAALDRKRYGFEQVKDRFHLILSGEDRKDGSFLLASEENRQLIGSMGTEAVGIYQGLMQGASFQDELTNAPVEPWSTRPDAVLLDILTFQVGIAIRQMYENASNAPKIFSVLPISTSFVAFCYGPVYNKLIADVRSLADRRATYQKYVVESGVLNKMPGLHPFYHHELDPNRSDLNLFDIFFGANSYKNSYDSMVTMWPTVLGGPHGELDKACAAIMASNKHYSVGPQLPPNDPTTGKLEMEAPGHEGEVAAFLDKQQAERGDHSVLYISFGSLEFPPQPQHLWFLLEVLDEMQLPYLMSRGNCPADLAARIAQRISESQGRGHFASWVPQVTVLRHKATMGFVTHGGSNSTMEALLCGVPMIQWPDAWDQPMIANQMDFIGAAIELLQVRGEHNVGRKTARGPMVVGTEEAIKEEMHAALHQLQGVQGQTMRQKVNGWGEKLRKDMSEGGEAYAQLKELAFLEAKK